MLPEIEAAVAFITRLIAKKSTRERASHTRESSSSTTITTIANGTESGGSSERSTPPSNGSNNSASNTTTTTTPSAKNNDNRERNGSGSSNGEYSNAFLTEEQIHNFSRRLVAILEERFRNHWYPEKPDRGQGYRCIRINLISKVDPSIERACHECGFTHEALRLPVELTIWIDPCEVTCRFGEREGSYCTVAKLHNGQAEISVDQIDFNAIEKLERSNQIHIPFDMSFSQRKKRAQAAAAAAAAQIMPQHRSNVMMSGGNKGSPGSGNAMLYGNGAMTNGVNGMNGSPYAGHHGGNGGALNGLTNGASGGNGSPHSLMTNAAHGYRLMSTAGEFCPQTIATHNGWTQMFTATTASSGLMGQQQQQQQQQQSHMMAAAVQQQQHYNNSPGSLYTKFGMSNVTGVQQQQQNGGLSNNNGSLRMASMNATGNNALVFRNNSAARISPPMRIVGGGGGGVSPLKRSPPLPMSMNGGGGGQPSLQTVFNLAATPFTPSSYLASNGNDGMTESSSTGGSDILWSPKGGGGKSIANKA